MTVLMFAVISGIVSVILAVMKVYLGYELESRVLLTDSEFWFFLFLQQFIVLLSLYLQVLHWRTKFGPLYFGSYRAPFVYM